MKIALIPCGITDWDGEGRLLGRVELSLSKTGQQECAQWAQQIESLGLEHILHAPDGLAKQTAAVLARQLSIPTRSLDDLVEVDMGLWAGLTESQLKTRYATAHRELREAPLNVNPPGGESLSAAAQRLDSCLRKQIRKKNGDRALGAVMRPFALAMARCALEDSELGDVWESARRVPQPIVIDYEEKAAVSAAQQAGSPRRSNG